MYGSTHRIHFIGVGGSGMSGLAEVLLNMGYTVSGSDLKATDVTDRIVSRGGRVFVGHAGSNVDGAQVVVYSSAVKPDNPELVAARDAGIPTLLDVVLPGPGDYWPRLRPVLALTDVFMPNEDESVLLTGETDPWRQAEAFRSAGVRTAIITRGGNGCVIVSEEGRFEAEAHRVPFVDGTGSGDAFVSGYISGLLRGASTLDCVRLGSAMGASCVRSTGATTGVFNTSELNEFMAVRPLAITSIR